MARLKDLFIGCFDIDAKAGLEPARISTVDFESTASRKPLILINNLQRTGGATARFRQQIAPAK
ncbi:MULTISPECIES: hypothetical protein [unclassified Klebsiella]|uniref:hypothetical protein n=1 Tax=unclassified Klebsiella TaxID=2608929 RepID=UPI0024DE4CDB|nr:MULTISPECIES: hypothetical protein [unclassified Klebsiella]MDK1847105.1 hypothetical protein [Klebsiella sp. K5-1]MDK1944660.1 hypothetical protein [Klebsiella sp. K4-32]MDK1972118.1 hypothetical protein [Klebsiella sp. K5-45]MDK2004392.1 hypothetical protein [Klebsiella sp. K4-44]